MGKALESMGQYFADTYAQQEEPKEKQQQLRHLQTDAMSYVNYYKEHGSEHFTETDIKFHLSQLTETHKQRALLYGGNKTESEYAEQQWQAAVANYHATNAALSEFNKPKQAVVDNIMDQFGAVVENVMNQIGYEEEK